MSQAQHIVVVDDEAPAREMVGDYLRLHGFEVTLCDGGASLRQVIGKQVPDLIVLDLNMPEEDGLSLMRRIRALPKEKGGRVPAVALTAHSMVQDRLQSLRAGFQSHVPKPVVPEELLLQGEPVSRVAYSIGFSSQSYFTTSFKKWAGETPRSWQKRKLKARDL